MIDPVHRPLYPALLQLIGHFVERGLDTGFVFLAARCARRTSRADDIIAYLDRERALESDDVAEMDKRECRIGFQALDQSA